MSRPRPLVIAIDGPAASGKGTLARRLAAHYGLAHLDTGSLYRAVAWLMLERGDALDDEAAAVAAARDVAGVALDEPALRSEAVGEAASVVAAIPAVRAEILEHQRSFARLGGGAVLDGRDIGTVVCPDAHVKFFVTASPEVRARRRRLQLAEAGIEVDEAGILAHLIARDERDRSRGTAPLVRAGDAHLLDTTNLDIEAAFQAAVELIDGKLKD